MWSIIELDVEKVVRMEKCASVMKNIVRKLSRFVYFDVLNINRYIKATLSSNLNIGFG